MKLCSNNNKNTTRQNDLTDSLSWMLLNKKNLETADNGSSSQYKEWT